MNTNSQCAAILAHLKAGKTITQIDALREYGCFRLGARIYDLRKSGYQIYRDMIQVPSGKRVAQYSLVSS